MGRFVNDPKDPDLLFVAYSKEDLQNELPKIQGIVGWGNFSMKEAGYGQHSHELVVDGLKVYLKHRLAAAS